MSLRRFSFAPMLFVVLWALWFALPTTRSPAIEQWKDALSPSSTQPPFFSLSTDLVSPAGSSRDAQFVRALNTPTGMAAWKSNRRGARAQALEALGRKFPNDPAICAAQLVAMIDLLRLPSVRYPGPSTAGDNWSVKLKTIETVAPQTLKSWFAVTARGAQLEPNNTFWDWAKLMGLLASGRDSEIWSALRAARGKTEYADHVEEGALASLRIIQSRGTVPPLQQIALSYASLYPHYASMREAARHVSDCASGLRLQGGLAQEKRALEGMRDFVLLARAMRRKSKTVIGTLVAQAIEDVALYGGSYSPTATTKVAKSTFGSVLWMYTSNPRSLAFFARHMKRPDIVRQMGSEWNELGTWRRKMSGAWTMSSFIGINPRDLWLAHGGDWLRSLFVAALPGLLGLVLMCSLFLWLVPTWRRERELQPSPVSWVWGAGLGVTAALVLSSPILYRIWDVWRSPSSTLYEVFYASIPTEQGQLSFMPPSWKTYFWAVQCFVAALWFTATWNARRQGKSTLASRLRRIFSAPDDDMTRFDLSPLLSLIGLLAAAFLATVGMLWFLITPVTNKDYYGLYDNAVLFLGLFTFLFSCPALWRLRNPQSRAFALVLARRFAWGQLLFLTLLWGLLWIVTIPAQRRFDTDFKRHVQIGEMQLLRKQIGI